MFRDAKKELERLEQELLEQETGEEAYEEYEECGEYEEEWEDGGSAWEDADPHRDSFFDFDARERWEEDAWQEEPDDADEVDRVYGNRSGGAIGALVAILVGLTCVLAGLIFYMVYYL